jgi:hypothetical protein
VYCTRTCYHPTCICVPGCLSQVCGSGCFQPCCWSPPHWTIITTPQPSDNWLASLRINLLPNMLSLKFLFFHYLSKPLWVHLRLIFFSLMSWGSRSIFIYPQ